MKRTEYLIIIVAIAFIVLAIIQWFRSDLLPMSLYMYIAWSSLQLTLLELIKTSTNHILINKQRLRITAKRELDYINREIEVFSNFKELEQEKSQRERFLIDLEKRLKESSNQKSIKIYKTTETVVTVLQVTILVVMFPLTMIKYVPTNLTTNKTIGILGLLSLAFLLISLGMTKMEENNWLEEKNQEIVLKHCSEYYLDLLDKIASNRP